jgi:hypothetical protein
LNPGVVREHLRASISTSSSLSDSVWKSVLSVAGTVDHEVVRPSAARSETQGISCHGRGASARQCGVPPRCAMSPARYGRRRIRPGETNRTAVPGASAADTAQNRCRGSSPRNSTGSRLHRFEYEMHYVVGRHPLAQVRWKHGRGIPMYVYKALANSRWIQSDPLTNDSIRRRANPFRALSPTGCHRARRHGRDSCHSGNTLTVQ